MFYNEMDNHYYEEDKIILLDLIRGYYFNDGFNKKINKFITNLFYLRYKYR